MNLKMSPELEKSYPLLLTSMTKDPSFGKAVVAVLTMNEYEGIVHVTKVLPEVSTSYVPY